MSTVPPTTGGSPGNNQGNNPDPNSKKSRYNFPGSEKPQEQEPPLIPGPPTETPPVRGTGKVIGDGQLGGFATIANTEEFIQAHHNEIEAGVIIGAVALTVAAGV